MNNNISRISYALKLSDYIEGFGIYLFLSILCNMAFKLLPILTSLVTSYLVSIVLFGEGAKAFPLIIATIVLVLLSSLFSYLDVQVSHDMAYRILTKLRDKCYDKLDNLAPAALTVKRSGDMISIILGDVETLEWFYAHTIGQLIVAIVVPGAALIFMGILSPFLPLVIIPFIIILVMIPYISSKEANEQGSKVKETTGNLNAIIVDGVQGIKDIISFRWQQNYLERFLYSNKDYSVASIAYAKRKGNESRWISLIMEIAALCIDITSVLLVINNQISLTWLMPLFVLSTAVFLPIQDALAMSINYGLIFGAAKRVLDIFSMSPLVRDTGNQIFKYTDSVEVAFKNVCFTYPDSAHDKDNCSIINGTSFSFRTGETVALVGASGSGKSTLARLLQRFWDVDNGKITINGTDIRRYSLESLRDTVTVIPQDVYLFNLSVKENLRLAKPNATDEDINNAANYARASEFIDKLPDGYNTVIGEQGLRLSGGEKQRLSIAQAFLKNSPILVLDEASANLDAENEHLINQAVASLKKGRATLIIAHRISTIKSADRIVYIRDGKIYKQGTYSDLFQNCAEFRELLGVEYIENEYL